MARKSQTVKLAMPKIAHRRTTWAQRTGHNTKSASLLFRAHNDAPQFIEDADGHRSRVWQAHELQSYAKNDIVTAVRFQRAVEREDLLEHIPPSAVKWAVTKGWLFESTTTKGVFWVTRKAAAELDLPRTHQGRKIQFLDRGL